MFPSALPQHRDTRLLVFAAAALAAALFLEFAFAPAAAWAEPKFGDSTWVAPGAPAADADPAAEGPRVAEPDHERTWETVLRTPFRVAFLPLRLLARGMEAVAGYAESRVPSQHMPRKPAPGFSIGPAFSYSGAAGPGAGVSVASSRFLGTGAKFSATGTWSLKDNRKVRIRAGTPQGSSFLGVGVDALYDYRPNRRFYGMGNTPPGDRTIYLRRDDNIDGWVSLGSDPYRQIRALAGYSDIRVGNGYSGTPHAWDVYSEAQVPFLRTGSDVWSYGASGDLAALNSVREPSHGVHVRGELRRVASTDDTNLDYADWRVEGRGYLPVLASRRVIALRLIGRGVNLGAGSAPVPFYRLPESAQEDRFAAYSSGTFRDRRLAVAHLEYRWLIWEESLWAVALAQRGIVAGRTDDLRYADMHESYGGGLRMRMSETRSARLEVAKGSEGWNVYLDLKGDF